MKEQKRLAFCWDFTVTPAQLYQWRDGLNEALRIIAEKYNVIVQVFASDDEEQIWEDLRHFKPTHILAWGSLDRPSFAGLKDYGVPVGLCFAGGPTEHPFSSIFDVIFVENDNYVTDFKKQGLPVVKAFGTNDRLFRPKQLPIQWKGIYTASFAAWKRHHLFYEAIGDEGLAVGKVAEEEIDCFTSAKLTKTAIMPEVPYEVLPYLYNQSEIAIIPAKAGGQRSVLEAMACNLFVIVCNDNVTTTEYVKDSFWGYAVDPTVEAIKEAIKKYDKSKNKIDLSLGRKYIENNYSAMQYADTLYNNLMRN